MCKSTIIGQDVPMRVVIAAIAAVALVPAALAAGPPRVHLAGFTPALVTGTGFHAQERVVVTVHHGTLALSKVVRTSTHGTFVARFTRDLVSTPCGGSVAITATGARGDHAGWKTPPALCGAQQQPITQ
jgi:hypothetical protein